MAKKGEMERKDEKRKGDGKVCKHWQKVWRNSNKQTNKQTNKREKNMMTKMKNNKRTLPNLEYLNSIIMTLCRPQISNIFKLCKPEKNSRFWLKKIVNKKCHTSAVLDTICPIICFNCNLTLCSLDPR